MSDDDDKRKKRRAAIEDYFKRNPEQASHVAGVAFEGFLSARYPRLDFSNAKIVLEDGREIDLNSEEGIEETAKLIATIPGGAAFVKGALEAHTARGLYEQAAKFGEQYATRHRGPAPHRGPGVDDEGPYCTRLSGCDDPSCRVHAKTKCPSCGAISEPFEDGWHCTGCGGVFLDPNGGSVVK